MYPSSITLIHASIEKNIKGASWEGPLSFKMKIQTVSDIDMLKSM